MTVADLVVGQLLAAGVKTLFGVPGGGGNLDLIAAAGRAGLPFVLTSTENAGAIAALAQAEVTGQPGACLTTLGPGAASVIKQQARRLEPAGVALGAIDWPALASSVGVRSWAATTEAELDRAAGEALACEGPTLIEAKIDRSNYGATLRAVRG